MTTFRFACLGMLLLLSSPASADASNEIESARDGLTHWISLWSPGDARNDAERMQRFDALFSDRFTALDDFTGTMLHIEGFDAYVDTWAPLVADIENWTIALDGEPSVTRHGDTVILTFQFTGSGLAPNGAAIGGTTDATHVWVRTDAGWKLAHEHLTNQD